MQVESIIYNKFYWWMSADDYSSSPSQYIYWENIDVKSNSNYIWLEKEVSQLSVLSSWISNWFITVSDWDNYKTYSYSDSWAISNITSWSTLHDLWTSILNVIKFWDQIVFAQKFSSSEDVILRKISEIDLYNWNFNFTDIDTWIVWWDFTPQMFSYVSEYLIVWLGTKIFRLDSLWVSDISVFEFESNVVWITNIWWSFKFYTYNWSIWLYDIATNEINELIPTNEVIRGVIQHRWLDYPIGWYNNDNSKFYYLNWYRLEDIQKAWTSIYWTKFDFSNLKTTFNWEIILASETKLYSFGSKKYWLPKWISIFNSNSYTKITSIWVNIIWDELYVWYTKNWNNYIWVYKDSNSKVANWFITIPLFNRWSTTIKKKIKELRIYSWWSVTISASIDWWAFADIKTIKVWRDRIYNFNKDFFEIVIKITLNSDVKFNELQHIYEIIEE